MLGSECCNISSSNKPSCLCKRFAFVFSEVLVVEMQFLTLTVQVSILKSSSEDFMTNPKIANLGPTSHDPALATTMTESE